MTGFGSFYDSTCKRVLDLLEPGDLTLGQVVIKRVAVVELGVNNDSFISTAIYREYRPVMSGQPSTNITPRNQSCD